jgi:hypothetical protein
MSEKLIFLKPKMRKNGSVFVTLREWAAYIFNCEFEPQTLDDSSKEILSSQQNKKKKYEMTTNNLDWATLYKNDDKETNAAKTQADINGMEEKELFLNVCEALETGGKNTKNAREKIKHGDAIKSMVEIVTRKWEWNVENLKEVMHMLAAPERTSKRNEEGSDEEYNTMSSSGDSATADDSESSSSEGDSDSESEGDNEELDDGENARDKSTNDVDEDNNSNNLNNDDVEVAKDINALDESKENETDDNDDDADE